MEDVGYVFLGNTAETTGVLNVQANIVKVVIGGKFSMVNKPKKGFYLFGIVSWPDMAEVRIWTTIVQIVLWSEAVISTACSKEAIASEGPDVMSSFVLLRVRG